MENNLSDNLYVDSSSTVNQQLYWRFLIGKIWSTVSEYMFNVSVYRLSNTCKQGTVQQKLSYCFVTRFTYLFAICTFR